MATFAILVDECVRTRVLGALDEWGYDARRCPRAGRSNSPKDPEVITIAAREQRIILTDDVSTLVPMFADYIGRGHNHPGILVARQSWPIKEYLRNLRYTLETVRPEDLRNTFLWLLHAVPAGGTQS